jgi:hypothetical protein
LSGAARFNILLARRPARFDILLARGPARFDLAALGAFSLALNALSALSASGSLVSAAEAQPVSLEAPLRVDGVAALVGGQALGEGVLVILRSDVELRARLALLAGGASSAAGALSVPLTTELLQATLNELLGESLIAIEASRLGLSAPTEHEVREQRARLALTGEASFNELLDALGVSSEEIDAIAERRARVAAFLAVNLEGTLDVSESELVRAYETEDHPFQGLSYAEERARFAAWIAQKRLKEAVGRWVLSLKERIPHRVVARF